MRIFLLGKGGFDEVYGARKTAATPTIANKYMMEGSPHETPVRYDTHGARARAAST